VPIDAGKGRDEVAEEVWNLIDPLIRQGDHGALQRLWSFN
jgi:hypothetical protein